MIGRELRHLAQQLPRVETRVVAIYRQDQAFIPDGSTLIDGGARFSFLPQTVILRPL